MSKTVKIPEIPPATGDDKHSCVFIKPVMHLKEKALSKKEESFGFDLSAIKKAEKALDDLSENFEAWINDEVNKLDLKRQDAISEHLAAGPVDELYRVAHDLKGQAATFGYPLVGEFCDSLCKLIDAFYDKKLLPILLIDQHVDAVRIIVKSKITSPDDKKANTLLKRLRKVTHECIEHEKNRLREDAKRTKE